MSGFSVELKYPIQKRMATTTSGQGHASPHNEVMTYLQEDGPRARDRGIELVPNINKRQWWVGKDSTRSVVEEGYCGAQLNYCSTLIVFLSFSSELLMALPEIRFLTRGRTATSRGWRHPWWCPGCALLCVLPSIPWLGAQSHLQYREYLWGVKWEQMLL